MNKYSTENNYCTEKLVGILRARKDTVPLAISELDELYVKNHGDGSWNSAPKRSLAAFLSSDHEIFHVDGENVALSPLYGEFVCLFRLEHIIIELTTNGPVNISVLGSRYTERFGTGYWKQSLQKTLPAFLAEYPDMFIINGSNVEMVSTYAAARCVSRLAQLLYTCKFKKLDISTLGGWYYQNFGTGYWKHFPGGKLILKSFLIRYSDDFVVDGEQVSLRITEARCVANLRQLLKSVSAEGGSSEVRSSHLASLYIAKYRDRDWKTLGKQFEAFLKEHPNDFQFTKPDNIVLVGRNSAASHNDTLTHQVDDADGNGDSVFLNGSLRTSTTESSSTRKTSFWGESEESTCTSPSTILPAAAELKAPEPWERRPASPAVSVVNFRISDILMPKPDNRTRAWRTTASSETSERDDADELTFSDLASELPSPVPSSDSHGAYGVRAAGLSKDRHHLALDALWGLDAERGGAAIGIGIGNGMGRRKSGLHERLKQSDPASRVGILEGLLELEQRRNELERKRNRDARDRIAELERLIVEREQENEELRDRIDRMEEMMVLEGGMRGLELNVY